MTLSPQHHPFDFITHSFEAPCRYSCAPVRVTCRDLPANYRKPFLAAQRTMTTNQDSAL